MTCDQFKSEDSTCKITDEICWRMAVASTEEPEKPIRSIGNLIRNLSTSKARKLTKQIEKLVAATA